MTVRDITIGIDPLAISLALSGNPFANLVCKEWRDATKTEIYAKTIFENLESRLSYEAWENLEFLLDRIARTIPPKTDPLSLFEDAEYHDSEKVEKGPSQKKLEIFQVFLKSRIEAKAKRLAYTPELVGSIFDRILVDFFSKAEFFQNNKLLKKPVLIFRRSYKSKADGISKWIEQSPFTEISLEKTVPCIPYEFYQLNFIEGLHFSNSQPPPIPKSGTPLLKRIAFEHMGLTKLPEEVMEMPQLEHLSIQGNEFSRVPKEIGEIKTLKVLDISKNPLRRWPIEELAQLENLQELIFSPDQKNKFRNEMLQLIHKGEVKVSILINNIPVEYGTSNYQARIAFERVLFC